MRHLRLSVLFAFVLTLVALVPAGSGTAAGEPAYTVTTLHFKVVVGPANDQVCDIVGDVYVPTAASTTNRCRRS